VDNPIPIEQIREAQKAFFPDGGRRAVHEVRHRSSWCKFCDRLREDIFLRFGVGLLAILLLVLAVALAAPDAFRGAVHGLIPSAASHDSGGGRPPGSTDDDFDRKVDRPLDRLGW